MPSYASIQVRQRTHASTEESMQKEKVSGGSVAVPSVTKRDTAKEAPTSYEGSDDSMEEQKFFRLLLLQIAIGSSFVALLITFLRLDSLAEFHEQARWFYQLQHITSWGRAHAGPRDACFIFTAFIVVITARALFQMLTYVLLVILRPDLSSKSKIRCTEQAWCTVYYMFSGGWGLVLLQDQPYTWSASSLWVDFPHYYIDPNVKRYYLCIFAFWFAQFFIIHLEDRRKDHWQMLTHHFVTCMLVLGSYVWSYTRIGHLVMIMMDTVDVFLSLAKCTKYLNLWPWITDSIFVLFLIAWVVLRHFVYMYEIIYAAFPAQEILRGKCVYRVVEGGMLHSEPVQCFSLKVHYFFFALTMCLQAITLMWLVLIVRVVMRVIQGVGAADSRSDSENET